MKKITKYWPLLIPLVLAMVLYVAWDMREPPIQGDPLALDLNETYANALETEEFFPWKTSVDGETVCVKRAYSPGTFVYFPSDKDPENCFSSKGLTEEQMVEKTKQIIDKREEIRRLDREEYDREQALESRLNEAIKN